MYLLACVFIITGIATWVGYKNNGKLTDKRKSVDTSRPEPIDYF